MTRDPRAKNWYPSVFFGDTRKGLHFRARTVVRKNDLLRITYQRLEEQMAARDLNMVPILSYPKDTTNTVTLTLGDMNRLDEGQFLNDSLIPPPW
jgi:hypothetical protein